MAPRTRNTPKKPIVNGSAKKATSATSVRSSSRKTTSKRATVTPKKSTPVAVAVATPTTPVTPKNQTPKGKRVTRSTIKKRKHSGEEEHEQPQTPEQVKQLPQQLLVEEVEESVKGKKSPKQQTSKGKKSPMKSPKQPKDETNETPKKPQKEPRDENFQKSRSAKRRRRAKTPKKENLNPITPESNAKEFSSPQSPSTPKSASKSTSLVPIISESPLPKHSTPQLAVQVHRFRNANYIPRGILKLCGTPPPPTQNSSTSNIITAPYLAVSREGGSVELVSVDEKWKCVSIVEGMAKRNVDAMAWVCGNNFTTGSNDTNDDTPMDGNGHTNYSTSKYFCKNQQLVDEIQSNRRLFGSSRDGTIFEIDFQTKRHIGVIGSGGGAVFCLSSLRPRCNSQSKFCNNLLAAGCEDGSVRIFRAIDKNRTGIASGASVTSFTAPCLELISTLPSVGCAITSIAWLPPPSSSTGLEGSVLYAGVADGTIRKFTVASTAQNARATGSAPRAMSTGIVLATSDDNTGTNDSTNQSSFTGLQWKANVRLTVENLGRRVATKIWSLQALDDGTLISGDSMGNVQFWDGNAGTLLQSFQHNPNNADVLDLVVNLDQNKVMASGVDSRVVCFQLNPEAFGSTNRWILSLQQRSHTHDVNSLTMVYMTDPTGCAGSNTKPSSSGYKELLCSGGVDTKVSSYFVSNMRKHRPKLAYKYPSSAPVALSKRQRIMSIMRPDQVDFYQLGDKRPVPSSRGGKGVALDEERSHLGSVRISTNYNLASFDLNDDGTLLAVSNAAGLHLFSLDFVETYEDGRDDEEIISRKIVKPSKIDIPLAMNVSCSSLKFSKSDPNLLICANCNGAINVIKVVSGLEDQDCSVSLEHTFNPDVTSSNSSNNYPITHLDVSPDGRWLAAGRNTIGKGLNVFALSPMFKHWWTLPCTEAPLSSMRWLGGGSVDPALAVALNNGVFYLFDVEQRCLSDWSQDLGFPANPNLPKELSQCQDCPDRLAFNPATPSKFLMGGQTWFCSIDLAAPVPKRSIPHPLHHFRAKTWGNTSQRQRSRSNSAIEDSLSPDKTRPNGEDEKSQLDSSNNFTICLRYSGMIFLDFLDENELVVVEQPWLGIVNQLPDALERQRYGS